MPSSDKSWRRASTKRLAPLRRRSDTKTSTPPLWQVNVLAQMGRLEEAEELFTRVTESANDLGLFAEEWDPRTGQMLGNFPQALTHLGVINAIFNLENRPSGKGRRSGRT